jgi:hypothetical protein
MRAGRPGAEPADPQIRAHEAIDRAPAEPRGVCVEIVQIVFKLGDWVVDKPRLLRLY